MMHKTDEMSRAVGSRNPPSKDEAHTCVRCGKPADLLAFEPDGWLCRPCADELGREAVKDSLEIFT
jgi:hypothetical protein